MPLRTRSKCGHLPSSLSHPTTASAVCYHNTRATVLDGERIGRNWETWSSPWRLAWSSPHQMFGEGELPSGIHRFVHGQNQDPLGHLDAQPLWKKTSEDNKYFAEDLKVGLKTSLAFSKLFTFCSTWNFRRALGKYKSDWMHLSIFPQGTQEIRVSSPEGSIELAFCIKPATYLGPLRQCLLVSCLALTGPLIVHCLTISREVALKQGNESQLRGRGSDNLPILGPMWVLEGVASKAAGSRTGPS